MLFVYRHLNMSTKIVESLVLIHRMRYIFLFLHNKIISFRLKIEAYRRSTSNEYIQVIFYGEIS